MKKKIAKPAVDEDPWAEYDDPAPLPASAPAPAPQAPAPVGGGAGGARAAGGVLEVHCARRHKKSKVSSFDSRFDSRCARVLAEEQRISATQAEMA